MQIAAQKASSLARHQDNYYQNNSLIVPADVAHQVATIYMDGSYKSMNGDIGSILLDKGMPILCWNIYVGMCPSSTYVSSYDGGP